MKVDTVGVADVLCTPSTKDIKENGRRPHDFSGWQLAVGNKAVDRGKKRWTVELREGLAREC